jgi:hypothetical protein
MSRSRFQQHFATWLACFAVILASMAPSVTQILAAQHGNSQYGNYIAVHKLAVHELVAAASDTAAHHQHSASADASLPLPSKHGAHAASCPFCHTTAASFALLPLIVSFLAGEAGKPPVPIAPPSPSIAPVAWIPLQPRAPPAGSLALS